MGLYQEIILLQHFCPKKTKWVVENVIGYYEPLIRPFVSGRHYFWSNFHIPKLKHSFDKLNAFINGNETLYGFSVATEDLDNKRKVMRNLVDPKLGFAIFEAAFKEKQERLF